MSHKCCHENCERKTMFGLCNKHSNQRVRGPIKERYPRTVMDTHGSWTVEWEDAVNNSPRNIWRPGKISQLAARLTASTILLFFHAVKSYFQIVFSFLESGPKGFITLAALHLALLMFLAKGL